MEKKTVIEQDKKSLKNVRNGMLITGVLGIVIPIIRYIASGQAGAVKWSNGQKISLISYIYSWDAINPILFFGGIALVVLAFVIYWLRLNSKKVVSVQESEEVKPASNADELGKYKDLLDKGIITQEEFDAKKKQLLGL